MSRQSINSETAEKTAEKQSLLPTDAVSLSPTVEFFLLFGLTLIGALSLVMFF